GRAARAGVHTGEKALQRRRDAYGAVGEQVVDLRYLVVVGGQLGARTLGAYHLAIQEAVVLALDGIDLHAAAEVTLPRLGGAGCRGDHALAAVADRCRVVDVVAGDFQPGLRARGRAGGESR